MRRLLLLVTLALPWSGLAAEDPFKDLGKTLGKGVEGAKQTVEVGKGKAEELAAEQKKCDPIEKTPITIEEELAFGGAVAVKLASSYEFLADDGGAKLDALKKKGARLPQSEANALLRYVNVVGKLLGLRSQRPQLEWKFSVLKDDKTVNAWSAPGGFVFVTTGLLKKVRSEDQLAGVLAHEIAHVVQRHALQHYTTVKVAECRTAFSKEAAAKAQEQLKKAGQAVAKNPLVASATGGKALDLAKADVDLIAALVDAWVKLWQQGYAKEAELESDRMAVELLIHSGYSVREYADFLGELPGGGVLATHPTGATRKAMVIKFAREQFKPDEFTPPPNRAPHPLGEELQLLGRP